MNADNGQIMFDGFTPQDVKPDLYKSDLVRLAIAALTATGIKIRYAEPTERAAELLQQARHDSLVLPDYGNDSRL